MIQLKQIINALGCEAEKWMWEVIDYRLKTRDKSSNLKEIETSLNDILYNVKRAKDCIENYVEECPEINKTKFTELQLKELKED